MFDSHRNDRTALTVANAAYQLEVVIVYPHRNDKTGEPAGAGDTALADTSGFGHGERPIIDVRPDRT